MHRLASTLVFLALTACGPHIQTSSGASFVSATAPDLIDPDIAKVAAIEPNLSFPARIGLARIVNGTLTQPPSQELALFADVADRNASYGEFVPVSPLIMAMVTDTSTTGRKSQEVVRQIRLTSARQHLDYVIIYEIGARSSTRNTPFALADVTLVGGMLLPTREIEVAGIGAALFVDVRNGYPYATTQVTADLTGFARTFQTTRRSDDLRAQAALKVAQALVPDIESMLHQLAVAAENG